MKKANRHIRLKLLKQKFLMNNINIVRFQLYYRYLNKFWFGIFIMCILLSFTYEIFLVNIPAPFNWMIGTGKVLSQIVYGYSTGYLVYFLTVFVPQIDKKIHLFQYLANRLFSLRKCIDEIFQLNYKTFTSESNVLSKEEVKRYLKSFDPKKPFHAKLTVGYHYFSSFYEYLDFKINQINFEIDLIMRHQDLLDLVVIRNISLIQDNLNNYKSFFPILFPKNEDGEYLSTFLENLPLYASRLSAANNKSYRLLAFINIKRGLS